MLKTFLRELLKSQRHQKGFSLVEIMVAITIIAMIMGAAGLGFMTYLKKSRIKQANMDITTLSNALDLYKTEFGKYPDSEGGLEVLVKEKILKDKVVPKDPWGNPYIYVYPGVNNAEDGYDIYSYGPDSREGGGDDITNWGEKE